VSTSPYILCASPASVSALVDSGLDLFSLANNHRDDCGEAGQSETQRVLEHAGLGFIGPGPQPVYREINGLRLAFLAFDATSQWDGELAQDAVRSARSTGAMVVVSMHWGSEYQSGPSPQQMEIAAQLSEAGVSLIWGHHPHVLQPAAWIGKTLVFYSLGNALFDQYGLAGTGQSALLLVRLDAGGVQNLEAVPFVIDVPGSRIVQAPPNEAAWILHFFDIGELEK
jgi:poly-gamma-glutamate synthesis protein (capsule biosynthesis protein)